MCFNIRNDGHLQQLAFRQLRFRIEDSYGVYFIIKQFNPIRMLIPEGIDINNATTNGKLTGFIYKVDLDKTHRYQELNQKFDIEFFALFDIDRVLRKSFGIHYFLHNGFGIGDQHFTVWLLAVELHQGFGSQHHVTAVEFADGSRLFITIRKQAYIKRAAQCFKIIMEIGGCFLIIEDKHMVYIELFEYACSYEGE